MKRYIKSNASYTVDKDDYNVQQYLPRRSLPLIEEITMELDFDNRKNRNINRYTVWFKNGDSVSGNGISGISKAVKDYVAAL